MGFLNTKTIINIKSIINLMLDYYFYRIFITLIITFTYYKVNNISKEFIYIYIWVSFKNK